MVSTPIGLNVTLGKHLACTLLQVDVTGHNPALTVYASTAEGLRRRERIVLQQSSSIATVDCLPPSSLCVTGERAAHCPVCCNSC